MAPIQSSRVRVSTGHSKPGRHRIASTISTGYFQHPGEDVRRDQAGEDAADHAAGRHPHVEAGEMGGIRPGSAQLAMAHEGNDEHRDDIQGQDPEQIGADVEHHHADQRDDEQRLDRDHPVVRQDRFCSGNTITKVSR